MKNLAPLALAACLCCTTAHALDGTWTATGERTRLDRINLGLTYGRTHEHGSTYATSALAGLTADQIHAAAPTSVRFTLDREAGRVDFEGSFEKGNGLGRFAFTPHPAYLDAVRALGVDDSRPHRQDPSAARDERLLVFTLLDVSTDYMRGMIAEGYRVSLDDYLSMRIFDVTPAYVRAMRADGWNLSHEQLLQARIHGVTPEFRDEMAKLGYRLSFDDLTAFRIHGVTPEWIAALRKLGYERLGADELISAGIFGVTPEFIRELRDAGYRDLPMSRLIDMRMHGVDADRLAWRRAI